MRNATKNKHAGCPKNLIIFMSFKLRIRNAQSTQASVGKYRCCANSPSMQKKFLYSPRSWSKFVISLSRRLSTLQLLKQVHRYLLLNLKTRELRILTHRGDIGKFTTARQDFNEKREDVWFSDSL